MSKSYPLLAIARKHNVPYGLVLSYADFISGAEYTCWMGDAISKLSNDVRVEITKQVHTFERSRNNENALAFTTNTIKALKISEQSPT